MKHIDCKWTLHWHGCDRSELFAALRPLGQIIYSQVVHNVQRLDDDYPETIQSSIEVDCLQLAIDLLMGTKEIRCVYGTQLHATFSDECVGGRVNLGTGDGFATSSASISYQLHKVRNDKVLQAIRVIEDAASTLRDLSVVQQAT